MSPSLQDVARLAGVSPSAASAALRGVTGGSVRLAEQTRQRVIEVAEQLGYRSNPLARGLRGQRTRTVGVLWWLGAPPAREFMARRLTRMFQRRAYACYVADHFSSPARAAEVLLDFASRGVDGVVVEATGEMLQVPQVHEALAGFAAAVVVAAEPCDQSLPADVVVHDRCAAIREAVDHFAQSGRRRPVFLIARHARQGKAAAFREQWRLHGLKPDDVDIINVDESDQDNLAQLAVHALDRHAETKSLKFDALLATSDELAVGAVAWLRERNRRVPADTAVVGFNDTHMAPFLDPPLASVDRREPQLVQTIEQKLLRRLETPDEPYQQSAVTMRFIHRESAGKQA